MTCQKSVDIYANMTCEIYQYIYNPKAVLVATFPSESTKIGYFISSNPFRFNSSFKTTGNLFFTIAVTSKVTIAKSFQISVNSSRIDLF